MHKKLLACDIDGTLVLPKEQKISYDNIQAIREFRNAGNYIALCSGHTLSWTLPLLKEHNLIVDALILCNGSMVYRMDSDNLFSAIIIAKNNIPNLIGKEILKYFYNLENYVLYWDNGTYTFELIDRPSSQIQLDLSKYITIKSYSQHIPFDQALQEKNSFPTIGLTPMSASDADAEKAQEIIIQQWGDFVDVIRYQYFVDIAPKYSSKAKGLSHLIEQIDSYELFGIGDAKNDLPLFQFIGKNHSFLMKNGDPFLEEYTHSKVNSVAHCIQKILSDY